MPRIERLHQNTAEWHRWRQQRLGASDAPVIMGEAAFKTPRTLWEGVGNFVFVSHTKKPERAGGRYGGEQGRRDRG